jgi:hypothetical protein
VTSIVSHIRQHCECCWTDNPKEHQSRLLFHAKKKHWACLDGTSFQSNHAYNDNFADCTVVVDDDMVGVVELKSRNPSASTVQAQLQNSASHLEKMLDGYDGKPHFVAAVLTTGINVMGRRAFNGKKVSFKHQKYPIHIGPKSAYFEDLYSLTA